MIISSDTIIGKRKILSYLSTGSTAKGQDSGDGGVLQADGFGYNCQ